MSAKLHSALAYGAAGWPVFPCRPRGKEPNTPRGFHDATTDLDRIAEWWNATPAANIGFTPGRAGLVVFDLDGREADAVARGLGLFNEPTLNVVTPRGRHLYFLHPGGGTVGNRKLHGVLDVRGDAGYVLLPPSVHPTGKRYRWIGKVADIRALPPAALGALCPPPPPPPRVAVPVDAGTPQREAYVEAAVVDECRALANTGKGNRNNRLNDAAFALARFLDTGELEYDDLLNCLTYAAQRAGLPDCEIARTIHSAFRARGVAV